MIDNYDSFTYNLVQLLGQIRSDYEIRVLRHDAVSVDALIAMAPKFMVISPGPGTPAQSGISTACVRAFAGRIPILGVCLGHQCIAEAFGARLVRAARPVHGKTSHVSHDGKGVFRGLEHPFWAARYHSLVIDPGSVPIELEVTATAAGEGGEIMGIRHRWLPVEGVQFHPESFLTPAGDKLLANFLQFG